MRISRSVGTVAFAISLGLLTSVSVGPRADIGLVGLWHLDELSGANVADFSGNDNHGTAEGTGAVFAPGVFGNAFTFAGTRWVSIRPAASMNVTASYTFEAWVYVPAPARCDGSEGWQGLFRRGSIGMRSQIEIYVQPCGVGGAYNGTLTVAHNRLTAGWGFVNFPFVPRDTWLHLAVTWDGSGLPQAYYDGVPQPVIYSYGTLVDPRTSNPPEPSYLGRGYYQGVLRGSLDEVHLWNRALTGTEILWHASLRNVPLDVKPGSPDNSVNLGSNGVVPVAVLTTDAFDASIVDPLSLRLAGAAPVAKGRSGSAGALEDVDGDGDLDLVVHFPTSKLQLAAAATEAIVVGMTKDGFPLQGSDSIRIVPPQK